MPTDDLFTNNEPVLVDPNKDYYSELVGEGKTYADNKAVGRAVMEKEAFINRLLSEQDQLRSELSTRIKYEDFLDKLSSQSTISNRDPQDDGEVLDKDDKTANKPEDLERRLEQILDRRTRMQTAKQNMSMVQDTLSKAYGPNYAQYTRSKMLELDMSDEAFKALATSSPKALFRTLGIDSKITNTPSSLSPPKSSISFDGDNKSQAGKGLSWYWNEIYLKKGPEEYFSAKVQNEIYKNAQERGDEFLNS